MSFINAARSPWVQIDLSHRHKDGSNVDGTLLNSNAVQNELSDTSNTEMLGINEQSKEKVTIIKYNDRFISLSPVQDYVYRCEALSDMCLYDWVARCERMKLPQKWKTCSRKKDDDDSVIESESPIGKCLSNHPSTHVSENTSNVFRFLSEHPLIKSHGTQCHPMGK